MDTAPSNIVCLIVEDDTYLAHYVANTLKQQPWIVHTHAVTSCTDMLAWFNDNQPDLVLLDLELEDGSSLPFIKSIKNQSPASKILIFTQQEEEKVVLEAFAQGADGYLVKDADEYALVSAIKAQLQGGTPMSPSIAGYLVKNIRNCFSGENPLSEREGEVLKLLSRGCSYDDVAGILDVKRTTIATYVRRVYDKLGVHNRTEAVFEAQTSGWIQ